MRNDAKNPCDINLIKVFSIHDYKCGQKYWEDNYTLKTGTFYKELYSQLGNYKGYDWKTYIDSCELWVTETNCNGDPDAKEGPDGGIDSEESCLRITG